MVVFENNLDVPIFIGDVPGAVEIQVPGGTVNSPGYISVQFPPGKYDLPINAPATGPSIVFQIAAGESKLVLLKAKLGAESWAYGARRQVVLLPIVSPFLPPWGCPGGQPPVTQPAQCPAWFVTPEPGKGVIVFENTTGNITTVNGIEGTDFEKQLPKQTAESAGRVIATFPSGNYRFLIQSLDIRVNLQPGQLLVVRYSVFVPYLSVTPLPVPEGCPGYVAPAALPPPPPTCPAWFVRPEPSKALLVVENHAGRTPIVYLKGQVGSTVNVQLAPKAGDEPGRHVLMLAPGHYEFEAGPYGYIRVDLNAGDMKVAPIYAPFVDQRPVLDLAVPPACN